MPRTGFGSLVEAALSAGLPRGFSFATLSRGDDYRSRVSYCEDFFGPPMRGSSRGVFHLSEECVLKVALNHRGVVQNHYESLVSQASPISLLARVPAVEEGFLWTLQERVRGVGDAQFEAMAGFSLPDLRQYLRYACQESARRWPNSTSRQRPLCYDSMVSDRVANEVQQLMATFGMPPSDLSKASSWGKVIRGLGESLVLADFGLSWGIYDRYYDDGSRGR